MNTPPVLDSLLKVAGATLSSETLSADENFFGRGATSLDAVRLISVLRDDYKLILTLESVFGSRDFAEMSKKIRPAD